MSENAPQPSQKKKETPRYETDEFAEMGAVAVLAIVAFMIDWAVIGPLEGRVF